ncbi:hypothetical protein Gogos_009611 [Gossypium gossypioides]|uniref:RING-type E3 ubiquitin transferase n=1 Tax=Gossypium gossypioides TaxID=34282 RepID=A0A7J9BIT3_GOSGO|nr:hypothetical protein [Gossypium gossypioides]
MNFLLRHLPDSESTCPLLFTTPSFKKSWDVELELQTGHLTVHGKVMYLHSTIQALLVESEINQETLMSRALAESRSEFERINNGMVAATESSIKEMIEKVKVEAGDEEKCMICLEEVEVGFEASQMPCSHVFHDDCIKKWLQQSHYCPICRFEMPID